MYISDSFEAKHAELVAEGEGYEEDRDEYLAENIFFVPKKACWSVVARAARKVLLPQDSAGELGRVRPDLLGGFNLMFYSSATDAVFKALGVE